MLQKAVVLTLALGISGSLFLGTGFCDEKAKAQKHVEKAIRKYHRLLENGKDERAKRLAETTAKNHPKSQAAQLLKKYSELLATSPGGRLTDAVAAPKASDAEDTLITAEVTIVDVPERFFEQTGLDFDIEMNLPNPKPHAEPIGIDARPIPPSDPLKGPQIELVAAEEQSAHAVLSRFELLFLQRALRRVNCKVLSRPTVRTLPSQPAKIVIRDQNDDVSVELVAVVSEDGKLVAFDIEGKSNNHKAHVGKALPLGNTLLMSLGTRVVEERIVHATPILNKIPYVSRLFKNTGIARETRHRLMFITPKIDKEPKSRPVKTSDRN